MSLRKSKLIFKTGSWLVLFAVTLMFTGFPANISAASPEKAEKSCCDGCADNEAQESAPCSTPVCPMFLCLSFDTVEPFVPQGTSLITTTDHPFVVKPVIKQFVKSILHPPSIV